MKVKTSVSIGELIDKISILNVKRHNIKNENKLVEINKEYDELQKTLDELKLKDSDRYVTILSNINQKLWDVEDNIRKKEQEENFDNEFIELARSVYYTNDKRFDIKNEINQKYGSDIREQKEYQNYKDK